ncbi:MAG: prolipoprotein diacylglyceryl transferase [Alphaproteobacteria bacterium]|nr:prolipoprotein diacylglyceryl transferase [Alphaproteobacteria bacterium]
MQFPNISPVAISILGFDIRWYALSYIFGFIFAFYYIKHILRHSTNTAISYSELDDLFTNCVLGVVIGGRVGYTLFYNFSYYISRPLDIFKIWEGGMSFHGGLVGVITTIFLWCRYHKKSFFQIADLFAMAAPIGLFLGRIANFINGELYGRPTLSSLGIIFPNTDGLPRHPSQLYEAFGEGLILFLILFVIHKFKAVKNRYGTTAFAFVGLYGIARIIIENFREPDAQIGFLKFGITMGQLLTIPMILASITAIIYLSKKEQVIQKYVSSPFLENQSIKTRFFTRQNGVSSGVFASANCKFETSDSKENVAENRHRLLNDLGLNSDTSLITVNQQHTNEVIYIDTPVKNIEKYLNMKVDGIITNQPNLAIGILTADCVPLLISDEKTGLIGAIHCGWQGIHKNIVHTAIEKMKSLGSNPRDIKVVLGPCLKQNSYEVDKDFMKNITKENENFESLFIPKDEKYLFDCSGFCKMKLNAEGIKNIEILPFDTYKESDLFFSYRRSVITKDYANNTPTDEGRQLSIIVKKSI